MDRRHKANAAVIYDAQISLTAGYPRYCLWASFEKDQVACNSDFIFWKPLLGRRAYICIYCNIISEISRYCIGCNYSILYNMCHKSFNKPYYDLFQIPRYFFMLNYESRITINVMKSIQKVFALINFHSTLIYTRKVIGMDVLASQSS